MVSVYNFFVFWNTAVCDSMAYESWHCQHDATVTATCVVVIQ